MVTQLNWGFNDNSDISSEKRIEMNLTGFPSRNRFYHKNPVGMYYPGRHIKKGWGIQHTKSIEELISYHSLALGISSDLMNDINVAKAINNKKYV